MVRKFWRFGSLDWRAAEKYLEKMAAKGYVLREIERSYGFFAFFEKTQPQRLRYCIDSCGAAKEEQEEYVRFAADLGWRKAAELPGQIVFVSEKEKNLPPMQTDWRLEYRQIRKGLWKRDLSVGLIALFGIWILAKLSIFLQDDMDWSKLKSLNFQNAAELASNWLTFFMLGGAVLLLLRALWFCLCSEIALRRDAPMGEHPLLFNPAWGLISAATALSFFFTVFFRMISSIGYELETGGILGWVVAGGMLVMVILVSIQVMTSSSLFAKEKVRFLLIGAAVFCITLVFVQCAMEI